MTTILLVINYEIKLCNILGGGIKMFVTYDEVLKHKNVILKINKQTNKCK